ncbi:hypothetical protein [Sodalis sp. dw_96]|uniref:hypothetical protein n=1 Tax=Sodalis sp. dw_96 TaxID=2719794 RepID=UPI001BD21A24|nr:hypothetical protein [Sodalis sp. dw_96]
MNNTIDSRDSYLKNKCDITFKENNVLLNIGNHYNKLNNIQNQHDVHFSSSQGSAFQRQPGEDDPYENADEKARADRLFDCVGLFKKNSESFSSAAPGKNIAITIADKCLNILTRKIILPNGYSIYVGVVADRWVISDGELYHIDDLVRPPDTWLDNMAYLLHQLAGVFQGCDAARIFSMAPRAMPAPNAALFKASQHLTPHGHSRPIPARVPDIRAQIIDSAPLYPSSWFLPGAQGARVGIAGSAMLSPWFRLSKNSPSAALKRQPRNADTATSELPSAPQLLFQRSITEVGFDKSKFICETNLHIANHAARELYAAIKQEFISLTREKIYTLGWMSELNVYLYDKLSEIYNDATYLNNKIQFADIIMIKKNVEKNIDECISSNIKKTTEENFIKDNFSEQRTIVDFFPYFTQQLEQAMSGIDFKTFRELIDFKNGISYADAKKNLLQLIKESPTDNATIYKDQLYMLGIMQQAQHTYEKLLVSDSIPLIDRLIYFNLREIYLAILDEHPNHLKRIIIKRFYYNIFEYSRNNGLSIQGNYLITPGELTEYRSLFDRSEPPLTEEEIAELVANQIVDYIHGSDKYHPHIDRLNSDIEFYRIHPVNSSRVPNWQDTSIQPYKDTLHSLDKSVETNLGRIENPYYQQNPQWINKLVDQVKYDKECILLLSFLEKLQSYLIAIVDEHQHERVMLGSNSGEQRLAEAKIQAMIMAFPGDTRQMSHQDILTQYFARVTSGDVELLLRAAIYWYIDYHNIGPTRLSGLNSLFIIKQFHEAKKQIALAFETRSAENFKKIFELKTSSEFDSAKEFYDQFIHYKDYSLQQEARQFTYKTISRSELDYMDMIYPPKEVYTFKIFSRNYVANSLAPNTDIYSPNNNFGTFSLIKTYSHKIIIACNLFSAPFIKAISLSEGNALLKRIIREHKKTNFNLNWINRHKIPVAADDLLMLFDIQYVKSKLSMSPLNLFLIEPEELITSLPKPDYVLVAGDEKEEYKTLIDLMDFWNTQMLKEIVDQLKISLREKKWWQELLALIPFYEILWKYWNDAGNKFNGIEIIFDTFDLAIMLGQLTTSAAKGTGVIYKRLLDIADIDTLPVKQLNRVISQKLVEELPYIARKSSGSIVNSLFGYLNPLPIHAIFSRKIKSHFSENMTTMITWMSNFILNNMEQKMTKFIQWSSDIDKNLLSQMNNDGTFTLNQGQGTTQNFIEIDDYFFQVIWDAAVKSWRVVKPTEVMNLNYAVPMYKNEKGKWTASYFLDGDRFSLTTRSGRRTRHVHEEIDVLKMEPLRSITLPKDNYKDNKWIYILMLELMINDYTPYMESLFTNSSDMSKMLSDFVTCLINESKFREVFARETEDDINMHLAHFVAGLREGGGVHAAYRMLRLWRNEHDRSPVDHIVIILKIDKNDYIVDMMHLRPYGAGLVTERQVFNEPEWALLIKKDISNDFPLIKYKDFIKINSAIAFPYREAGHPGRYVKSALLLREPIWYKTAVIKYHYRYVKKALPSAYESPSILSAARTMIFSYDHLYSTQKKYNLNITFPFLILNEAKLLDAWESEEIQQKVTLALGQNYPTQGYMSSMVEIIDSIELLKIKPGKLLGIFYEEVFLIHLLLSVGDGRFAGVGNNLFNPQFDAGPSIILAEEMGTFADGKLTVRDTHEQYSVIAGNPVNAPVNETVMSDRFALQTVVYPSADEGENAGAISYAARESILTQDNWTLAVSPDNEKVLTLKMEAVAHNLYPVYSREMSHIIRGLLYANSRLPDLADVLSIEFITLFDGFAVVSHRGQILADDLRLDIQLNPYLKTDSIMQRHPQWFTRFSPATDTSEASVHALDTPPGVKEGDRGHKKIKCLADMVEMLITVRKSLNSARIKRNVNLLPAIFSDLARLVIRDMNFYDFTGQYQHQLDKESEEKIYHILREYQDYISEGDEYYLQCYFDILLSVEQFRRMAESIYPMPLTTPNETLPLWPYIN